MSVLKVRMHTHFTNTLQKRMTLLQGCLGWFKYAWIKINTKLFKNTMIFNQILSYLMIWNWYLIWPGDHNFWIPKFLLPILKSILLAPKIVLILKSYMKNGKIQIKSMYLKERIQVWAWSLCSHNWILLVRTVWALSLCFGTWPQYSLFLMSWCCWSRCRAVFTSWVGNMLVNLPWACSILAAN